MHICTAKSLRAGIDMPPIQCPVCKKNTMFHGWLNSNCDTCGADTGHENLPDYMHTIRKKTGLTRKQIGVELGYKYSTVKKYEFIRTSSVYWNKFKIFIEYFYKNKSI
jgi:hypothetical protein